MTRLLGLSATVKSSDVADAAVVGPPLMSIGFCG
jgi:hypothetical protein